MLAKSIIAGTVLSLMAGGVVYFGTDIDTDGLKEKVTAKTAEVKADLSDKVMTGEKTEAVKSETSVDTPSVKTSSGKVIEAKQPTISYSSKSENKKTKTADATAQDRKTDKKWLDQYLKKEEPKKEKPKVRKRKIKTAEVVSPEPTAKEQMEETLKIAPKDSYGSGKGASRKDTGTFIIEEDIQTDSSKTGRKKATRKMLHDIIKKDRAMFIGEDSDDTERKVEVKVIANEDGETTIETETIDMGDGKIMKIVKKTMKTEEGHGKEGKKMRLKVMTDKDGLGDLSAEDIRVITIDKRGATSKDVSDKDIFETVKVVMAQAEKIKMSELRDRAYLDLVSYGLEHGDYKTASKALANIKQVELRDTARNRIAVAYAKDGNAEKAFGILDDLEVDTLRDVMRLQVIEAMIAPDQLPADMQ